MPNLTNADILIYTLATVLLITLVLLWRNEVRLRRMLRGKNGKDLEDIIGNISKELKELQKFESEAMEYLKKAEVRMSRGIQGVATVRFNPFKGTGSGGNQSFSTAFVNEQGDGVVISSLYTRERVSTFSKPLLNFASEHELTSEEKESIERAREKLSIKGKAV